MNVIFTSWNLCVNWLVVARHSIFNTNFTKQLGHSKSISQEACLEYILPSAIYDTWYVAMVKNLVNIVRNEACLGLGVFVCFPYSPDLSPCDYFLYKWKLVCAVDSGVSDWRIHCYNDDCIEILLSKWINMCMIFSFGSIICTALCVYVFFTFHLY